MTKVMPPSEKPITKGQIGKWCDVLASALVKSDLRSEPTQLVLQNQGAALAEEFVSAVRKRVEAISNMFIRHVRVDRSRSPQQVLDATGRIQYTDKDVVATMPGGEGTEIEVFFFKLGRYISDADLEMEYDLRNLKPDPYAQAAVNEADSAFADEHPNGTHWKDANGKWCFVAFHRWDDERSVSVDRYDSGRDDRWWFAGVRK